MKNNTGKETKPQFKLRSWDRLEVTCRNESHLNSLLASRWRLPWFQTCNIHRLYIKDGRNAELEFNASFPLAPTHLNLAFGHFPLQLNYHLCVGGVFIATRPKIPTTSCDTNNIVTEGMRTMWWCTCWLCAAIFIAGFQKYGWISGWMDGWGFKSREWGALMANPVMSLSDQSVACSLLTAHFQLNSPHLEPWLSRYFINK